MISNEKGRLWIKLALIFCWCVLLTKSDAYLAPYLLMGMLGTYFCIKRRMNDALTLENAEKKIGNIYAAVLATAVVLANYKLFIGFGLSGGKFELCKGLLEGAVVFCSGMVLFREILTGIRHAPCFQENAAPLKSKRKLFAILWGIMALEYAIVLFASQYPGELTTDSISQMMQLFTHSYSNHHPYYHTQLIHLMVSIGLGIFGEINQAVAVYSVFSIVVMTSCFIYVTETVYACTKNLRVALIVFACYLLMPFHIIYSFTMWKDVFFGAAVTGFAVSFYRCLKKIGNAKVNIAMLFLTSMGMALLRSNGFLAFFLSAVAFFVLFGKKQRRLILLFAIVLISAYMLKHPVLNILQVSPPDTIESLSVPAQQIARVIADEKELTAEQKHILSQVVDLERVPETYCEWISDPIKNLVREKGNQEYITENAANFIKVYLQLGLKYPHKYIEAWIDQTRGYWNGGYAYWRWACEIYQNDFGIQRTVNSEWANNLLGKYLSFWETSPLLQIFLSIGLYVWGIIMVSYRAWMRKNKEVLFITIPFLAVILSLMVATPVYSEFRYAYAIFCGFPFVLSVAFAPEKKVADGE